MSGLPTAELKHVTEVAGSHVGPTRVPGMVVRVTSAGDVHVVALGALSIGGPGVQRDSLFRIASITKPIFGALTMALVDERLVSLEGPVDQLLPELASPRYGFYFGRGLRTKSTTRR